MAIIPVRKLHIVGHRSLQADLVATIQKMGVVEVCPSRTPEGKREEGSEEKALTARLRRIDDALRLLRLHFPRTSLLEKLYPPRPKYRTEELEGIVDAFDLGGFLAACESNRRELEELDVQLAGLEEERRSTALWASLDVTPSQLRSTTLVQIVPGRIAHVRQRDLVQAIEKAGAHMERAWEDDRHLYAVVLCHRSCAAAIHAAMKDHGFQVMKLPDLHETPAARLAGIDDERREKEARIAELRDGYRSLALRREELFLLRDVVANHLGRIHTEGLMGRTSETVLLEGWIPLPRLAETKRLLGKKYPLVSVSDSEPRGDDRPPVLLENPPAVGPFTLVVDLYGLPRYGAIDPSAILAAFFAIFFGLCLTDAGYGILLAAVTGGILFFAPRAMPVGRARFFKLLFICGLATAAAGTAAGGWFGFPAPWRLFDPLEDLMLFFAIALAVGTAHIFAGLLLRMVRLVRDGDVAGAIADQGLWMVLILFLYLLAAAQSGYTATWLLPGAKAGALLSALAIVFFQGRSKGAAGKGRGRHLLWAGVTLFTGLWILGTGRPWTGLAALALLGAEPTLLRGSVKGVLARVGLGLYALYGITGYLSDVLSYSRLVALGLGTGIVALVVNKMAGVAYATPGVGFLMAAAVLVVGHLFNIMINLLGAFVHSCRLQYVEFFTKFYESGGKPFRPFRIDTRYITLEEKA